MQQLKKRKVQRIHLYGQPAIRVRQTMTVEDMRSIAHFNCIIRNYIKMNKIKNRNNHADSI